jgi:predicted Zn-dependent protease
MQAGNRDAAAIEAGRALEIDPENMVANATLVRKRFQDGDYPGAVAQLDALIAAKPGELTYELLKLQIVLSVNDGDAARQQLERMVDLYPEETRYRQMLVQLLVQRGDADAAEDQLRALAAADPENLALVMDIVAFRTAMGGREAGRAELAAQIAAAPAGIAESLRLAMARFDLQSGRREDAIATLEELAASGSDSESVNEARAGLAEVIITEDPERAASLAETVLAEDESHVGALAIRARLAIADYRPADAIRDLRVALDADPDNVQLMLLEATAHERNGNITLAGERLASASRAADYTLDVSRRYAQFLQTMGDVAGAETVIEEVTRRHPRNAEALRMLADLRLGLGDWAGAEQAASALMQIEGNEDIGEQIVAFALTGQGQVEDSTARFEALMQREETQQNAMIALVRNYVSIGEVERAVSLIDNVLDNDPGNSVATVAKADLHLYLGEMDQARDLLKRSIRDYPQTEVFYLALARLGLGNDEPRLAEATLQQGLELFPKNETLRFTLAQTYERLRDYEAAIAQYQMLYELNPSSVIYANNLASLLAEHRTDDPEQISRAIQIAQRLRGYDSPHLQDTYGWLMYLSGDNTAALRSLVPAAEGLPQNPYVRYHIGHVYAALEEYDLARSHLEAALAIDGNFSKAASAREILSSMPAP